MEQVFMGEYDIIVVGAGHAGCEAALASARMGNRTMLFTINLEAIAMMPCNPSIGGTGKGHLVREIDALGGEMGKNIDKTFIQSRMLNTAKGPAVHSLRAQADKHRYHTEMKKTIEQQENLHVKQAEIVDLIIEEGKVCGVVTMTHTYYKAKAVVLATGTFLRGKIFIGDSAYASGPNGLAPSIELADNLKKHGMKLRRFKTGTPARALASTFDYTKMTEQKGDERIVPFSFMNDELEKEQVSCWLTYTNEETHTVIRNNFHRSALFGGQIEGVGPRYCPSIEDKINRFADKERHQTFIEPEGLDTEEMYIQGMSSSLPEDVQEKFYHTIPGLENIIITRPAYAIEYDCIDPLDLKPNLENRMIKNLFCAGQFNGSSGYEEAAAQGIIAGINAAMMVLGKEPLVPDRSESYIGVLIDDLVTKENHEPYRMMTSRAEYRLLLRQDNADLRLSKKGYHIGLISKERYEWVVKKEKLIAQEVERIEHVKIGANAAVQKLLTECGSAPLKTGTTLAELIRRPELQYEDLAELDPQRPELAEDVIEQVNIHVKYDGYIKRQLKQVKEFKKLENKKLPENFDYNQIKSLRIEAKQKLNLYQPVNVGQASRISGVSPADISVLLIYFRGK